MSRKDKFRIFKLILFLIVVALVTTYIFSIVKSISTEEGKSAFKEKITNLGFMGMLVLFVLQVAQIFLIIIPGEPVEILAGVCYGAVGGTIFIMLSACIISTGIFLLVRKYGKKFVYEFCDKEKIEKVENSKLFNNPREIQAILFILFLIPGTPKDLLVYISGLLPIKTSRFILISTFARFPSVISSTLAGAELIDGNWKLGIILYGLVIIVMVVVLFIINKFDKHKTIEKIYKAKDGE